MTVYVDDVRHRFGRMIMCHLFADTLDELLAMADRIGVARKWIQGHPQLSIGKAKDASWLHFDISLDKKASAIAAGAVLTDRYGPLEFLAKRAIASGDPKRIAAGEAKLEQITKCRAIGKAPA
jgi:Protein of unknown function (DUF4031)